MLSFLAKLNWRMLNILAFASTVCLMLGALFYFQLYLNLPPCNLCIIQRTITLVVGAFFLVLALLNPKGWWLRLLAGAGALVAYAGAGIAIYHVWLQGLPPEKVPECGPNIGYMLESFGLWDGLMAVFASPGDCAEVHWSFLTLSIPGWVAVWLIAYALFLTAQVIWPKWPFRAR